MYYSRTSILCRVYTLPLPLTLLYFYSIPYSIPYLYLYLHLLYSIFKYHTSIDALDLQPDWRASQLERRRQHPETSVGRQDRQAGRQAGQRPHFYYSLLFLSLLQQRINGAAVIQSNPYHYYYYYY